MRQVGFLGGSFDPIHFGHIHLAISLLEKHLLDEVLFCPTTLSPFKVKTPPIAKNEDRLKMLELALDHPQFKVTTLELDRKGVSYTIDTIKKIKEPVIHLLLSDEAAKQLDSWKNAKELVQLAPPYIGTRELPISSTEIRQRLKKNLYCSHLVPAKTLDYIKDKGLYSF